MIRLASLLLLILFLGGCSSSSPTSSGRYSQEHDSIPTRLPNADELIEPIPRSEPPSPQGNRTYSLFGKTYAIIPDARGHVEEGYASWYGEKFHGHLTSNGETYDMYAMSAAHKTLPLPTYVRVTNLANNRAVVVRVNDRGPFHGNRVLDLSYVAAYKLGMLQKGTAKVRIEALHPDASNQQLAVTAPLAATEEAQFYIQVVAGSNADRLNSEAEKLAQTYAVPATTQTKSGLYAVMLGPFAVMQTEKLLEQLRADGYHDVFRVPVTP
ncbi:septal ring lytic transglycosylase RlpA family protein [Pseudidiomarina sediminum]|uniref:Endolytic peptidoglycan transglycosylase RlpA n=1 Tax=Pseudidiomarina sediminum TaxID=431675 RepID=A0A432Z8N1_9GAMM|nr:septal ring lytic transglycosylase RlpA family protein [Pseudidiomarina sediminum]RUO74263.1 septal ring lytic transglycosylase RlpA family protein [Pseudidiomarina sediminum]